MDTALPFCDPVVLDAEYGAPAGQNLLKMLMPSPKKASLRGESSASSESLRIAPIARMSLRVDQACGIDSEGCPHEWTSVTAEPNATGIVVLRSPLASVTHVVRSEVETTEKLVVVTTELSEAISQLFETAWEHQSSLEAALERVDDICGHFGTSATRV